MTHSLLERETFLKALGTALAQAAEGRGRVALVEGEAGAGKTTLLQHFAREQRGPVRLLWGACDSLFTPRPLGPLHDIAAQTGGRLLAALNTDAPRHTLFAACLAELQQPVTVAILEDMHWADEATLDFLTFLGRRIARTSALLIVTYRDDELDAQHPLRLALGDLPRAAVTRLWLPPLSEAGVHALAQQAGRTEQARAVFATTRGNPFFVTEALANESGGVPTTVRDAVLARAARLSPPAREVLELVSMAPGALENALIETLLRPTPEALDECITRGMLRGEGEALAFRHELARRAVADTLPPARSRQLHARFVAALLAAGPRATDLARLIHHASGAEEAAVVLQFGPLAAQQAASVDAHQQAAAHYETVLRYADGLSPEEYGRLLEAQAYEYYLTSQVAAAVRARTEALSLWQRLGRLDKQGHTLRWLSRLQWFLGQRAAAEQYALEAIQVLERLPPSSELAMAYSNRAQIHMLANEYAAAQSVGARAVALAEALGDADVLSHALNNLGSAELLLTGAESGRVKLERSLQIALDHDYQEHAARAYTNLASAYIRQRNYAAALRNYQAGINYSVERDLDAWSLYILAWRARAHLEQGSWTEAADDAQAVLNQPRGAPVARIVALAVLGSVRVRRGDPSAQSVLDEARDLALPTGELQRIGPVAVARAEAAWLAGDRQRCAAEMQMTYDLALASGNTWELGEAAYWMWRAGTLPAPPANLAEPFALQIAGDWRAAAQAWQGLGCPYEQALALMDGDLTAQQRALELFQTLGARPAAKLLAQALGAASPRQKNRARFGGLTEREQQVAALIAQGRSNRDIADQLVVGVRTVETYVTRILTKLGFDSRVQIATWALETGLEPPAPAGRAAAHRGQS